MTKPRPHADLIKAWADGAKVEYLNVGSNQVWSQVDSPRWDGQGEYRIKREPKPDTVELYRASGKNQYGCVRPAEHWERDNLRLTFDGETGKLKSAEVI
jgi:hypothetical protein